MEPELHQAAAALLNPQFLSSSPGCASSESAFPEGAVTALLPRLPRELSTRARLRTGHAPLHFWRSVNATLRGHALVLTPDDASKKQAIEEELTGAFEVVSASELAGRSGPLLQIRGHEDQVVVLDIAAKEHQVWMERLRQITIGAPVLSDFVVENAIGKGGGGLVFLVRPREELRRKTGQFVSSSYAMKVIPKYKAFHSDSALQHCLDERLGLQLASSHPFIVTLRHAFQTEKALYLITDFCKGGDLRGLLNRVPRSRLPEAEAVPLFSQIVLAIEHLHSLNIVYRDLKPENILLSETGNVRLCDLGLAKFLNTGRWGRTKSFCGTVSYMSPEIVRQRPYGIATDLWSLGALFYRVLVGRMPFDDAANRSPLSRPANDTETFRRIVQDDVPFPSEKSGLLSPAAYELLRGLLEKDESKRLNLEEVKESTFFAGVNWEEILENGNVANESSESSVISASDSSSVASEELANFDLNRVRNVEFSDSEMSPDYDSAAVERSNRSCRKKASAKNIFRRVARGHTFMRKRPNATSVIGYAYTGGYESDVSQT